MDQISEYLSGKGFQVCEPYTADFGDSDTPDIIHDFFRGPERVTVFSYLDENAERCLCICSHIKGEFRHTKKSATDVIGAMQELKGIF